jgi:hypothetical protein
MTYRDGEEGIRRSIELGRQLELSMILCWKILFIKAVAQENTCFGPIFKLVGSVGSKKRETLATKNSKEGVIRIFSIEFGIGRDKIESGCRQAIDDIDRC